MRTPSTYPSKANPARWLAACLSLVGMQVQASTGDTLRIVCFGNSTTAPRKKIDSVYPVRLEESLRKAGIACRVYNEGLGGSHAASIADNARYPIRHGLDRFEGSVLERRPDWVVLAFGINDSWQDEGKGSPSRIGLDRYSQCLQIFKKGIDSIGGRTVIMGPNPLGERYPGFRHRRLDAYRRAARRTAEHTRAEWVDLRKGFLIKARVSGSTVDALLLDGMHPNDKGHRVMAEALAGIILEKQTR